MGRRQGSSTEIDYRIWVYDFSNRLIAMPLPGWIHADAASIIVRHALGGTEWFTVERAEIEMLVPTPVPARYARPLACFTTDHRFMQFGVWRSGLLGDLRAFDWPISHRHGYWNDVARSVVQGR